MARRVFTLAAVVSLVLFVAVGMLWARSGSAGDVFGYQLDSTPNEETAESCKWFAASGNGTITLKRYWSRRSGEYGRHVQEMSGWFWETADEPAHVAAAHHSARWGFTVREYDSDLLPGPDLLGARLQRKVSSVTAPLWAVPLLFAVTPLLWYVRRVFARRRCAGDALRGRCARCSYDLRATPGRCPECGTVPANATPAG